jgi:hypothetical protein
MKTLQDLIESLRSDRYPQFRDLLPTCEKIEAMYHCSVSALTIDNLIWARPDITILLICGKDTAQETEAALAKANEFFAAIKKMKKMPRSFRLQ